ncbi:unnamed protein product, partial [Ectocarpus fasciculatus]
AVPALPFSALPLFLPWNSQKLESVHRGYDISRIRHRHYSSCCGVVELRQLVQGYDILYDPRYAPSPPATAVFRMYTTHGIPHLHQPGVYRIGIPHTGSF